MRKHLQTSQQLQGPIHPRFLGCKSLEGQVLRTISEGVLLRGVGPWQAATNLRSAVINWDSRKLMVLTTYSHEIAMNACYSTKLGSAHGHPRCTGTVFGNGWQWIKKCSARQKKLPHKSDNMYPTSNPTTCPKKVRRSGHVGMLASQRHVGNFKC